MVDVHSVAPATTYLPDCLGSTTTDNRATPCTVTSWQQAGRRIKMQHTVYASTPKKCNQRCSSSCLDTRLVHALSDMPLPCMTLALPMVIRASWQQCVLFGSKNALTWRSHRVL